MIKHKMYLSIGLIPSLTFMFPFLISYLLHTCKTYYCSLKFTCLCYFFSFCVDFFSSYSIHLLFIFKCYDLNVSSQNPYVES